MTHITRLDTRTGNPWRGFVAFARTHSEHNITEDVTFYVGANPINHSPVLPC